MSKLIIGCGFLGSHVADLWVAAGETVMAVTRSEERASVLQSRGIKPILADITSPKTLVDLPSAETVLFAVGQSRDDRRPIENLYVDGLRHVLERLTKDVKKLIYVSTTGVYEPNDLQWIEENSPCGPITPGAKAHLQAEQIIAEHPAAKDTIVLRMAGMYGPSRLPRRADLAAGRPVESSPDGVINLIHVEDAARIVQKVDTMVGPPEMYVVSDGQPVLRRDFLSHLAELFGTAPPVFQDTSEKTVSRGSASKRIRNHKLVRDLAYEFLYPSYQKGLSAALEAEAE